MAKRFGILVSVAILAATSACGSSKSSASVSAGCASAFAAAANVDDMHDTLSDLFPAYSACASVDEWKAASAKYPDAIGDIGHANPVLYAQNVCAGNAQLTTTAICRAVATPEQGVALALDEIRHSDPGTVTGDLLHHPSSVQAKYVDAVMHEAGLFSPLGFNDKNLIVYGLDSCSNPNAALPSDWEAAPGDTQADVDRFAAVARSHATGTLCP